LFPGQSNPGHRLDSWRLGHHEAVLEDEIEGSRLQKREPAPCLR
jgi:hypothetical protein